MTISLDTEIVATRFDAASDTCFYTIARDGSRWTVAIPQSGFQQHGANMQARRDHLSRMLSQAMAGPPDPPPGKPGTI